MPPRRISVDIVMLFSVFSLPVTVLWFSHLLDILLVMIKFTAEEYFH